MPTLVPAERRGESHDRTRDRARLTAIEPNPHMHRGLARAAARHGVEIDVVEVGAESTGLPDQSADAVVCTLVLCTVADPAAALAEVRRILRRLRSLFVPVNEQIAGVVTV